MAAPKKASKATKQKSKSNTSQAPSGSGESWEQFAKAFPNHPTLDDDAIYALPNALLDAIDLELPDFLTDQDRKFEKTLRKLSGGGFFLKSPFGRLLLTEEASAVEDPPDKKWLDLAKRQQDSSQDIKEMLADEMIISGRSNEDIKQYFENPEKFKKRMQQRQDAYAGWLVTDPGFRKERDEFCKNEAKQIRKHGCLPHVPISLMGEATSKIPKKQRPFYASYMSFYRRWGLERLATWDLPVPMRAEFLGFSMYHLNSVREGGVSIFVPYYLLRDRSLTLYEVAEQRMLLEPMGHLKRWLELEKDWGFDRYAAMFQLYVYLELAIKRRYEDRLKGNVMKLDQAFARYKAGINAGAVDVDTTAETIKKNRLQMNKRLKQTE